MDYESIGEHQKAENGIYEFWQRVPAILIETGSQWVTPSEAVAIYRAIREYDCGSVTSWADSERDLSAWTGNAMQQEAMGAVHALEDSVQATHDPTLIDTWARLQTSDHFYWMSTKGGTDGEVQHYFSPYQSSQMAFDIFMSALGNLKKRIEAKAGIAVTGA